MKVVKTDWCCSSLTSTLDDLMEINVEGPTPKNFSADDAVHLWWADRMRRPNEGARKEYMYFLRAIDNTVSESSDSEPEEFALDGWDKLFME